MAKITEQADYELSENRLRALLENAVRDGWDRGSYLGSPGYDNPIQNRQDKEVNEIIDRLLKELV